MQKTVGGTVLEGNSLEALNKYSNCYLHTVWNWNWALPLTNRSTVKSFPPLTLSCLICTMGIIVTTLQVWYMDLP